VWLQDGGLEHIRFWAENEFTDYVKVGDLPPTTRNKRELIEDSRPDEQRKIYDECCFWIEEESRSLKLLRSRSLELNWNRFGSCGYGKNSTILPCDGGRAILSTISVPSFSFLNPNFHFAAK
jgi:hypothetical protein